MFFSSPNSVTHFIEQINLSDLSNVNWACVGVGTQQRLHQYGITAHFVGTEDTKQVAAQFKQILEDKVVLFPKAKASNRTIQKELKSSQVLELDVYSTSLKAQPLSESFDAIVCTSPSNVEAMNAEAVFNSKAEVIAIGLATSKKLESINVKHTVSKQPNELALAERVFSLL